MSILNKATYILYGIANLAPGFWAFRGFFKLAGSSKQFPKSESSENIKNSNPA